MFSELFAVIGRIMLALIFIVSGAMKLGDISGTGALWRAWACPPALPSLRHYLNL